VALLASHAQIRALQDPYATLGVQPGASEQEVKKAHRKLVKQVGGVVPWCGGGRLLVAYCVVVAGN